MVCWEIFSKPKLSVIENFFPSRNSISLLCISFSKILSILDKREMGLYLDTSSLKFCLWMGITLVVFRKAGKTPVENDKLQTVARWFDIWSWRRCKTLVGILLDPQDLLLLTDDIIL